MSEPNPCKNGCWWNPEGPGYNFKDDCEVHGKNRPGQCVPATRTPMAHPAEKLAVAAFTAEQVRAATPAAPDLWNKLIAFWKDNPGYTLPIDSAFRKLFPIDSGWNRYFPAAIACAAAWSNWANQKHNPGEPLHHSRGKSMDHLDCLARHSLDAADAAPGRRDDPATELEEKVCRFWRAGADLQETCERLGAPLAPAARLPETQK